MTTYTITADDAGHAAELAEFLNGTLHGYGLKATADGSGVDLSDASLDVLADLGDDHDGHFDGMVVWVGGVDYPVSW